MSYLPKLIRVEAVDGERPRIMVASEEGEGLVELDLPWFIGRTVELTVGVDEAPGIVLRIFAERVEVEHGRPA